MTADSKTSIHSCNDQDILFVMLSQEVHNNVDLWSLSGANPSSGSEQTTVVVTARAMGKQAVVKCLHQ